MYAILNDELAHHGIKGQKWGVRRFQNTDGSLKLAGEKRYGSASGSSKSEQRQQKIDTYKQDKKNQDKLNSEMDKLINSDKRLKRDFGSSKNVDDHDAFDLALQDYGIKADSFYKAKKDLYSFRKENSKSIKEGQKLSQKYDKKSKKDILNSSAKGINGKLNNLDPKVKKAFTAATAVTFATAFATVALSKNAHKNDTTQRVKRTERKMSEASKWMSKYGDWTKL